MEDISAPKMQLQPANHKRKRIIEENLLQYMDIVKISERDKAVVLEYVSGSSYKEISEKYGFSPNRIPQIAFHFIRHCSLYQKRTGIYSEK